MAFISFVTLIVSGSGGGVGMAGNGRRRDDDGVEATAVDDDGMDRNAPMISSTDAEDLVVAVAGRCDRDVAVARDAALA